MRYFLCVLLIFPFRCYCQEAHPPISSSYLGIGAYSNHQTDIFSLTSNISAAARISTLSAGVSYENRFLLSETNYYSGVVVLPTSAGNFILKTDYFGFKNYNESEIGIGYGKSFGSELEVGIKFNYYHFSIPKYLTASTVAGEAGIIYHFTKQLTAGINIFNPVGGTFNNQFNSKLSSIYSIGIGYETSDQFLMTSQIVKEEQQPLDISAGMQYILTHQFFIRCGTNYSFNNNYVGAGISWENYRLDMSFSFHPALGVSPGIMFIMNFNKQSNE